MTTPGCDTVYENPNAASSEGVLNSVDGLRALAIGMRREYSVEALSSVVRVSGLTAREFAVVVGFTNPQELELGGAGLPAENGITTGLWLNHYQVIGMADQIIDNVGVVEDADTRTALLVTAHFFKAAALGNLAQFYQAFPTVADEDGEAPFVSREEGLQRAVTLLEQGVAALGGQDVSSAYKSRVLGTQDFNLLAASNAYLARYRLMLGDYAGAITAADAALAAGGISVFVYDAGNGNENPLYLETTEEPATLRPVDNFGLDPATFVVPDADGRKAFYLAERDEIGESSRIPVETMLGFYDVVDEPIPVYLPDEMRLIKAEAFARQNNLSQAIASLNEVLTDTDDPFGVNAGLPAYGGAQTQAAVLEAIYQNRRVELFLTGLALEDSRRFDRPAPPASPSFDSYARTRTFLPYPVTERDNNPNVPADPAI
jgi:hypothetical protein